MGREATNGPRLAFWGDGNVLKSIVGVESGGLLSVTGYHPGFPDLCFPLCATGLQSPAAEDLFMDAG